VFVASQRVQKNDKWNWIQIARRPTILTVMPRAIDSFRTLDDIDVIEYVYCILCNFLHLLPVYSE